ncbi:Glycine-rich RNA-binding protein 4, mitochondrial [Morella rubra]|uniref:Glycine-rich RNA-binding protein 4, mitochondrial n=1 Tax=Morella rubra TaxID=262757 RepID=A0A6A1VRR2_9ROSI|nr:Glycine-rich RNA-binding protein 4, mitochondrial [Morella rubra]
MALLHSFPSQSLFLQSHRHTTIPKKSVSETPILPSISPQVGSSISYRACTARTILCSASRSLQRLRCSTSSSSSVQHGTSSSVKIFIKGLPQSTSEGQLNKAFSEYGEVSQVKLMIDRESGESLGFAYIWFTREDSAALAVKEMNGKFFDGRFVRVTIAKAGLTKRRGKATPFMF